MGLDVGVLGAEQRLGPLHGEPLGDVHHLAAAVVPGARIALGVLVRERRAQGGQHGGRGEVLRGDRAAASSPAGRAPRAGSSASSGSCRRRTSASRTGVTGMVDSGASTVTYDQCRPDACSARPAHAGEARTTPSRSSRPRAAARPPPGGRAAHGTVSASRHPRQRRHHGVQRLDVSRRPPSGRTAAAPRTGRRPRPPRRWGPGATRVEPPRRGPARGRGRPCPPPAAGAWSGSMARTRRVNSFRVKVRRPAECPMEMTWARWSRVAVSTRSARMTCSSSSSRPVKPEASAPKSARTASALASMGAPSCPQVPRSRRSDRPTAGPRAGPPGHAGSAAR